MILTEIDAEAKLMLESNREKTFENIAARPQLSTAAQVYLVEVEMDELMLESNRRSVILALINNPCFVSEAKMEILANFDAFMLESSRQNILDRLNRRGRVPSGNEMDAIRNSQPSADQALQIKTTIEVTYSTGL